jgi:hypothetical protein
MIYRIEKHTTSEWIVTAQNEGEKVRYPIAKCPSEGVALTIKGMYEKDEKEDE